MTQVLVAADESQLELRIAAYLSRDPVMIDAFRRGLDLHTITTEAAFGVVNPDTRRQGKVANFLVQYGGQADKFIEGVEKMILEQDLEMPVPSLSEARRIIQIHHSTYPAYWRWRDATIIRTRELGYSETAFGRPRYLPDILSSNPEYRTRAERQCVAHAVSGTAADMLKMAMIHISKDEWMSERGRMLLQCHDELVCEVDSSSVGVYAERLRVHLELGQPFQPWVDLVVDVNWGDNWKQAHK